MKSFLDERPANRKEVRIDLDRTDGRATSISHDVIGDLNLMNFTTGVIAAGETGFIFLTDSGAIGGVNPFVRSPTVTVKCDANADPGGLARGQDPIEGVAFKLCTESFTEVVEWLPGENVYKVSITNNTGTARDFVVQANGV